MTVMRSSRAVHRGRGLRWTARTSSAIPLTSPGTLCFALLLGLQI